MLGAQAAAAEAMAQSGQELSHAAAEAAGAARYEDLRPSGGQVDLAKLRSMRQPVQDAKLALDRAQVRLDDVRSTWLVAPIADPLAELRRQVSQARADTDLAAQAVDAAPGLLGGEGPRRYLILFANTAESRYLGGFVAAYGELSADNGRLALSRSGRITELSDAPGFESRTLSGPQEFLDRFGRLFPQRFLQNLTASPDFEVDAGVARELYPKAGGHAIDGVIYVDPFGLQALLKLTGPVPVEGAPQPLSAENAATYLLRDQYVMVPEASDRTDLMSKASRATFEALTSRQLPGPRALADSLGPAVREGRLHMVTFDEKGRNLLDRLGAVRSFPHAGPDTGDFFAVRSSNANPNKIDSFLRRDVTYEATVDARSGQEQATATIVLHNDAPGALLPPYIIGNEGDTGGAPAPPGTNTMFLSVYSSLDLERITYDGSEVPVAAQAEAGHNVYSMKLRVPPKSQGTLVLVLRGQLRSRDPGRYELTVAPQPMVNADQMKVHITPGTDQRVIEAGGLAVVSAGVTDQFTASETRRFSVLVGPP